MPGVLFLADTKSRLAHRNGTQRVPLAYPARRSTHAHALHGLGLFAPEVHELSGNGFRDGLEQALHVLQLWPSFIQPASSQRRQTGSLRGGGAAVLTATCLLVSSLSRFPIAVVSSMIDPFIVFPSVVLFVRWASSLVCVGATDSTRLDRASGSRALPSTIISSARSRFLVDPCQDSPRQS